MDSRFLIVSQMGSGVVAATQPGSGLSMLSAIKQRGTGKVLLWQCALARSVDGFDVVLTFESRDDVAGDI